jgi:ATP-dependent DNA helicase PIF1
MLLKNLDTEGGLVNGARGVIVGFERPAAARNSRFTMLPVVEFSVKGASVTTSEEDSMSKITKILSEEIWDIRLGDRVLAQRSQIPLMLAWAISIHKSQGMTLPYLEVSCSGIFEYGQGYVALSRATDLKGLKLQNFDKSHIRAHHQVHNATTCHEDTTSQ